MIHFQTPYYAIDPLLPYLPAGKTIWESAAGEGQIVSKLRHHGFTVIGSDILTDQDFFTWQPASWDIQITTPASKLKYKWLARSYELAKPFALLMPVETLGAGSAHLLFDRWGIGVILLNRRVNFKMPHRGYKGSANNNYAWFTWGLGINQGNLAKFAFGNIVRYPDSQMELIR